MTARKLLKALLVGTLLIAPAFGCAPGGPDETSDEIANSYGEILTYGLKDDYWNTFVGDLTALTPADVNASAGKLVKPDALTWVVVGDLSKIEKPVRALNFGEVTVLDADGKVVSK